MKQGKQERTPDEFWKIQREREDKQRQKETCRNKNERVSVRDVQETNS